jgi:hypothetical protein
MWPAMAREIKIACDDKKDWKIASNDLGYFPLEVDARHGL